MADLKISQLSAATALAGTEVVPVVQGGATKKATIDQILAPASGKGINFSAAGGDTLTMYDEGTWTPSFGFFSGASGSFTYTSQIGYYTRIGRLVTATFEIAWSAKPSAGNTLYVALPMTSSRAGSIRGPVTSVANVTFTGENLGAGFTQIALENAGASYPGLAIFVLLKSASAYSDSFGVASLGTSGSIYGTITFEA